GSIDFSSGNSTINGNLTGQNGSQTIISGNGSATFFGTVDIQSGATLKVSAGSVATFFGTVDERTGSLFTGTGTKNYEGVLSIGNSPGFGFDEGSVILGSKNTYLEEIGGLASGQASNGYDQFAVAGTLTFGGTLKVVWYGGFSGSAGESFKLFELSAGAG